MCCAHALCTDVWQHFAARSAEPSWEPEMGLRHRFWGAGALVPTPQTCCFPACVCQHLQPPCASVQSSQACSLAAGPINPGVCTGSALRGLHWPLQRFSGASQGQCHGVTSQFLFHAEPLAAVVRPHSWLMIRIDPQEPVPACQRGTATTEEEEEGTDPLLGLGEIRRKGAEGASNSVAWAAAARAVGVFPGYQC